MAEPTNLLQNWQDVVVSWEGVTLPVPEVVDLVITRKSRALPRSTDGLKFPSFVATVDKERRVKIVGAALNVLVRIPEETACTVTATLPDLTNGTGAGAILFTAVNARLVSNPFHGRNNELATTDAEFLCYSDDDSDPFTTEVVT